MVGSYASELILCWKKWIVDFFDTLFYNPTLELRTEMLKIKFGCRK